MNTALEAKTAKVTTQLVPPALLLGAARAAAEGTAKYGDYSWRRNPGKCDVMSLCGAVQRHLSAYINGEEIDPDSSNGKHHLDGVAMSTAILLDGLAGGYLLDNRPPAVKR